MYAPGDERMGFDGGTGGGPVGVVELIVWLPSPDEQDDLALYRFSRDTFFFANLDFSLIKLQVWYKRKERERSI
jgi:hypothetical protein